MRRQNVWHKTANHSGKGQLSKQNKSKNTTPNFVIYNQVDLMFISLGFEGRFCLIHLSILSKTNWKG